MRRDSDNLYNLLYRVLSYLLFMSLLPFTAILVLTIRFPPAPFLFAQSDASRCAQDIVAGPGGAANANCHILGGPPECPECEESFAQDPGARD